MEFEATSDAEFWRKVRDHYADKKKHLVSRLSKDRLYSIGKYLKMYEGLTYEELQNALENEKARNEPTYDDGYEEYDDGYEEDALRCLLTRHEPLKPPYSHEELLALKDAMPPGTDLPPQFVEYLTQVSREMVFYDEVEQVAVSSLKHHVKEITTYHTHAPNCKCWTRRCYESGGAPRWCPEHTPEQRQKAMDEIARIERLEGDAMNIHSIYLGWDTHATPYMCPAQVLVCDKNSLFGKVFQDTDDGSDTIDPDYQPRFKSFKSFVEACIQFETTGVRNWGDDDNIEEVDNDDGEVDRDEN